MVGQVLELRGCTPEPLGNYLKGNAPANHVRSMAKQRGVAHGLRVRRLNAS
jgi:hypothetical protein